MRLAQHASGLIVDRWAPERGAVMRQRSLGTLRFADRLLAPYVARAEETASPRLYRSSRSDLSLRPMRMAAQTSWLFPVPWYEDELEWMAAAREGARTAPVAQARPAAVARAVAAVTGRAPAALEYVAPSFVRAPSARRASGPLFHSPAPSAVAAPLRAWSALASYPATQAAEVMAGVLAATRGDDADVEAATATPVAPSPVMELVAPSQLAPSVSRARAERPVGLLAGVRARLRNALALHRSTAPATRARAPESMVVVAPPPAEVASERPASPAAPAAPTAQPTAPAESESRPTLAVDADVRPVAPAAARQPEAPVVSQATPPAPSARQVAAARAIELLTEAVLSGGQTFAPVSGPRVALPAGLGGLVAGVRAAEVVARPIGRPVSAPARPSVREVAAPRTLPSTAQPLVALAPGAAVAAHQPRSAVAALEARRPVSFAHVAWTDRWLARFAGASRESLAALRPAAAARPLTAAPALRPYARLALAPDAVYVSGDQPTPDRARGRAAARSAATTAPAQRAPELAPRLDDAAPVSDDVFRTIAAAPSRGKARAARPAAAAPAPAVATLSIADHLVRRPPVAPGAGVRPGLAASPLAPALASVMPLPPSPAFDVRAMAPDQFGDAFLDGFIEPVVVRMSARRDLAAPIAMFGARAVALAPGMLTTDPRVLARLAARAPQAEMVAGVDPRPERAVEAPPSERPIAPAQLLPPSVAPPIAPGVPLERFAPAADEEELFFAEVTTPFVTAQTAPWVVPMSAAVLGAPSPAPLPVGAVAAVLPAAGASAYRDLAATWSPRPGHVAQLAHTWSVEQEHQVADLSLDFVAPEVIIAARAYGFGPAQAAQAARLAVAGEPGLSAMASAVDMTLLQAITAAEAEGGGRLAARRSALQPRALPASAATATAAGAAVAEPVARVEAAPVAGALPAPSTPPPPAFAAVPRRARGAFLWPSAAVSALGLSALDAEAAQPHTLAALDLLAARAVAEAGAFPMVSPDWSALTAQREEAIQGFESPQLELTFPVAPEVAAESASLRAAAPPAADAGPPPQMAPGTETAALPSGPLPPEFHEIFVALSQTAAGRSLPPSVRAARALALAEQAAAGRPVSARARAAAAWAVMPMVLTAGEAAIAPSAQGVATEAAAGDGVDRGTSARRGPAELAARAPSVRLVGGTAARRRPGGLHAVAARAGESLGSLVAPFAEAEEPTARARKRGGVHMAPTAAQPLVQTGASRHESVDSAVRAARSDTSADIPAWFEAAARRHLADTASSGSGITLAEMTLVTAAPVRQVAAQRASATQAPRTASRTAANQGSATAPPDVEKLARDVYSKIVRLIEIARDRSGDPWLS